MQGLGQLLASSILLAAILCVLADKTGLQASDKAEESEARGSSAGDDSQSSAIDIAQDAPTNTDSNDRFSNVIAPAGDVGYSALEQAIRTGGLKLPLAFSALRPASAALGNFPFNPPSADDGTSNDGTSYDSESPTDGEDSDGQSQQGNSRVKRGGYNAPYFVGKRSLEEEEELSQEELQKRQAESEENVAEDDDLAATIEELGLLDNDDNDDDKRARPMFVGKRPRPMFVGKRLRPMFVGKRARPYFVGKRLRPTFVGKRARPMFVGKRARPMFVGKRARPFFVGKRARPMFVGKRARPFFVGKRARPMFVGKRQEENLSELLAALHTLQAARQYRRMIQADKRYESPLFVGRRSDPSERQASHPVSANSKDSYIR